MSSEEPRRRRTRKKRSFNTVVQMRNERSLIALLRDEVRFRWAVGGVAFLFAVLAVLVSKVWVSTPKGFLPIVKVSGLDLLQSASFRHSGASLDAEGDFAGAVQAWESATANNPADLRNLRGLLDLLAAQDDPEPGWRLTALRRATFLLKLTRTNVVDLERTALVMEKYGDHDWITTHLPPRESDLGPVGLAILGRTWFRMENMPAFDAWWRAHGREAAMDPSMQLFRTAWEAGWGPTAGAAAASDALKAAAQDPARQAVALPLQLATQARALDLEGYRATLEKLVGLGRDLTSDQTRWWRMLVADGRVAEARSAARRFRRVGLSDAEIVDLTAAWRQLGLDELAADYLTSGLDEHPALTHAWLNVAGTLADAARWVDLRLLAQRIRNSRGVDTDLAGYSHYLEGLAEDGLERRPGAEASFEQMLENPPADRVLLLQAALTLMRRGYPEPAGRLLQMQEEARAGDPGYWARVAENALTLRDAETILYACRRAHELEPEDPTLANNYAASLIAGRTNAPEAIRVTVDLVARQPDAIAARLNHALALVLNGRHAEGLAALDAIPEDSLPAGQRSGRNLGRFEALAATGRIQEARAAAAGVDPRDLLAPQAAWFGEARKRVMAAGSP